MKKILSILAVGAAGLAIGCASTSMAVIGCELAEETRAEAQAQQAPELGELIGDLLR